ncbi:MAG: hypothetical protein L0H59_01400 [Tomitella sp.]|nr:hypothetical protein [Tomitella sp.]
MTSPRGDVDPLGATTIADFAACLRDLRVRAGNPSYRTLALWGERNNMPLPRSTVRDALTGLRLPGRSLVLSFVRACGVPPDDHRWEVAWTQLAGRGTAQTAPRRHDLARDVDGAGLLRIGATYLNELEWRTLFADVTELDIVVAYGQTWRNLHARELAHLATHPACRMRVVLTDPEDELAVAVLADRFAITPDELRARIIATRQSYEELRRPDGARIELYYRPGDRVFSFYRFDDVAVVGLYSHTRVRGAAVPVFVCAKPGELYEFIQDELAAILDQSRLV